MSPRGLLTIPADWFRVAPGMPSVCARHGLPAVRYVDVRIPSTPRIRFRGGGTVLVVARVMDHLRRLRITAVNEWPLCAECMRTRSRWLRLAAVLCFGGVALFLGGLVQARPDARPGPLMAAGILMVAVSALAWRAGREVRISRAATSDDGQHVLLREPSPQFADQMVRLINSSPGYHTAGYPVNYGITGPFDA